jgi:signal transduction histidine kinase
MAGAPGDRQAQAERQAESGLTGSWTNAVVPLPRSLRARILIAFLAVVVAAVGTLGVAVLLVGPGRFANAMGHLPGDPMGEAMVAATMTAFTEAVREALLAATITAVAIATVVSLAVAARIIRPVSSLAEAARRIASGHYAERVPSDEPGELGELATSFNEMAGSLEATERRRIQLVGDVAHELRTPLTTLDGYLEGLEDGVVEASPETWRLLRAETARLTRLVSDLAELWRAEARQLPLRLEPVEVGPVIRDVVDGFGPQLADRSLTISEAGPPATAIADRDRLAQVLGNYLSNALRHAPDRSAIVVRTAVVDARRADWAAGPGEAAVVRIAVVDEGPGLPADQLEAVFERFYRLDPARSRAAGGAGIGLAIVRALASAMGGRAWAESAGPGNGATFYLELPAG